MAEQAAATGSSPADSAADGGAVVVGPQYCSPNPVEVVIKRKVFTLKDVLEVTNANGDPLFKVESTPSSFHDKRIITDSAGNVILTLRLKTWSMHSRWQAFRGASSEPRDLLFTTTKSCLMHWKTKLQVYLGYNTREEFCDFKVKGSFNEKSCVVYAGESNSAVVAQMQKKVTAGSIFLGKDQFMVTVYPNIDNAFIVALIVILDAINSSSSQGGTPAEAVAAGAAAGVGAAVGAAFA